jgi:hypothetical protein
LIRAEEQRPLCGFWTGQRLRHIEGRLKIDRKQVMATPELHDGDEIRPTTVRRLTKAAVELNQTLGNPTEV